MNIPINFLFYFENINVNKFNGKDQLNFILNSFIPTKENPLNFNIYAYMNKHQNLFYYNPNYYNKYMKLNEHFFTYYNTAPFTQTNCIGRILKYNSIIIHVATLSFSFYVLIYENKSYFLVPCINFFFYYFIFLFIVLCICLC